MTEKPSITLIIAMGKNPMGKMSEHSMEEEGEMAKEKSALQTLKEKYVSEEGHFKGKKGSGERFDACVEYQRKRLNISQERAEALCSMIGRKAYGKNTFQKMAAAGKK